MTLVLTLTLTLTLTLRCARFVDGMINRSLDHWSTTCYDKYQQCMLGIM